MSWLTTFASLSKEISAAGGAPIIATAEPAEHLASTRESSGYEGRAIVDPENLLAAELKRRGKLDVAITEKKGYDHGMAQPAVLVMKEDGTILQKWEIVPSAMNIGGAKDRPSLQEIWENSQALLDGRPVKHTTLSTEGFLKLIRKKIFG